MQRFVTYLAAGILLLGAAAYILIARGVNPLNRTEETNLHVDADAKVAEVRGDEDFERLEVSGPVDVYLTIGNDYTYKLSGPEELLERMEVRLERGTLDVGPRSGWSNWNYKGSEKLRLEVTVKTLSMIDLTGAVKLRCNGVLKTDRLRVDLSGATNVELELDTETLNLDCSGATNVRFKGTTDRAVYDFSGASKLYAADLKARVIDIDASGAANAEVHATEALHVETSGASTVKYHGSPTDLAIETSGASKVQKF